MRPTAVAGFTLIELILVLVLTGALAVVALPAFFDRAGFGEYAIESDLVAAARFAQKTAVASGCDVQFAVSATGYRLSYRAGGSDTSCGNGAFSVAVTDPQGRAYAGTVPDGVTVSSLNRYFDALGRVRAADGSESGGTISVGTRTITLTGGTGYVQR